MGLDIIHRLAMVYHHGKAVYKSLLRLDEILARKRDILVFGLMIFRNKLRM
jgi:hypothetical protein